MTPRSPVPLVTPWSYTDSHGLILHLSLCFHYTPGIQGILNLLPEDCEPSIPPEVEVVKVLLLGTTPAQGGAFLPTHPINIVELISDSVYQELETTCLQAAAQGVS